tara:strand:+ start:1560 stop:1955 length:396 start_codon:yes stop_codon:yes gene_type:complete
MIELYAKIVSNKITEVSSGKGTTGTWVAVEGYQGEDQTLTYDPTSNTVKCEDKIDEVDVPTIEELDAVKLELDKEYVRGQRNRLLVESDWTQNRDVVLSNDADWKTYRQSLRDLPANTSDWSNPTWPTKPS